MVDNSLRNEEICRDKIMDGMTHDQLGEKYGLTGRMIRMIVGSAECSKYITKYKRQRDEIAKETVESVKKLASKDAMRFYTRLTEIIDQKSIVVCPECDHEISISISDSTTLRAILSAMGIAGIKIKQDEDIQRDLPTLSVRTKAKQVEAKIEKKAG